ncbi:protein kinase [Streptomyces clavuligerus]|nr:protein kinase [Streptomyces clavuligerus]
MSLHFDSLALPVRPGYRVGPWEVGEPIATSAFATVYAAHRTPEPGTGQWGHWTVPLSAALKFLPPGTRTSGQLQHLRRITERETSLLRRTGEPRLIRTYEIRTVDDPRELLLHGATALVMERAERSLADLLRLTPRPAEGPALLAQICAGLRQLHHAGWVHGGLKPGNVLLLPDGTVRLGDFHLATEGRRTPAGTTRAFGYAPALTTTECTAPELLWSGTGERVQPLRPAADIWAFGVLAHRVLTGALPLPGDTPGTRREATVQYARGEGGLELSPELPESWRGIVGDCLARAPEARGRLDTSALLRRVETAAGTERSPRLPRRTRLRPRLRSGARLGSTLGWSAVAGVVITGMLTGLMLQDAPIAKAAGYDRCATGELCFFSEHNGQGEMCAWYEDGRDGHQEINTCAWGRETAPRSVLNNGYEGERPDARFYQHKDFKEPVGCLQPLERRNLNGKVMIRSVKWLPSC